MAESAAPDPNRRAITVTVMLAAIMQVLDTTIANVALPQMQAALGATQETITWVLTSYIVASAIATPLTGWLSDRFGRRPLFLAAVAGFTLFSMLCGAAMTIEQMVVFRMFQGLSGAMLVPLAQAVILDINPRERHGQAMATWSVGVMVGPIMGPVLGGWLTDSFNWRFVFYVNLPLGILAFVGAWIFLPKAAKIVRRFDFFGFALLSLAVGALQLMLDRGEHLLWFDSTEIIVEAGIALAALWMFGVHIATARAPFIDPRVLTDRNFLTALIFIFAFGIMLFSTMALLPPMLQVLFGYPTITTGLALAPNGLGTMVAALLVGRIIHRVDPRLLILIGLGFVLVSLYQMTGFSLGMDMEPVVVSGIVRGIGFGLIFTPLSTIAFATLAPRFRVEAASLFSLVRNLGSSIGISIVVTMLARSAQASHSDLVQNITPFNVPLIDPRMAEGLGEAGEAAMALVNAEINRQALMIAYLNDFQLVLILTLAVLPLVLLLRRPKHGTAPTRK